MYTAKIHLHAGQAGLLGGQGWWAACCPYSKQPHPIRVCRIWISIDFYEGFHVTSTHRSKPMHHLIVLGDSILENAAYTDAGPAVIDQVCQQLPAGWRTSLLAADGDTCAALPQQLTRLPADATHLALSVGGNDALGCIVQLEAPASSVKQGLSVLSKTQADLHTHYRATIDAVRALNLPLMVCTIYDNVPGLSAELRTALALFNDVILREAIEQGLPVLDLRMVCTDPDDYCATSPIEPSSQGCVKLATALVAAMVKHDFAERGCHVYG